MLSVIKKAALRALYNPALLSDKELIHVLAFSDDERIKTGLFQRAKELKELYYGKKIYFRALIEFSNICRKNCYYCGLRRENSFIYRYRMTEEEIFSVVRYGYAQGFRTFVLQSGEDPYYDDERLVFIIKGIKVLAPKAAITLSLGERESNSYRLYRSVGADRYLLRHEAYNPDLYYKLHPSDHSYKKRLEALHELKSLGYQVGAGFMVGAPFQTEENLVEDLMFLQRFKPHMVGIGPFISNKDTPFAGYSNGNIELTFRLLSLIRLILPKVLLPATTSLETIAENGRLRGFEHGANVIMPNLTPDHFRVHYKLYDNKAGIRGCLSHMEKLNGELKNKGFELVIDRGDYKEDV